jgi:CBS domain-containing protein
MTLVGGDHQSRRSHPVGHSASVTAHRAIGIAQVGRMDLDQPARRDQASLIDDIVRSARVLGAVRIKEREMLSGHSSVVTVANLMTGSPVVVSEDDVIAGVAELLAGYEITGLPVVDSADRLVGVISQTDLVRLRGSTLPWAGWHGLVVRDLMTKPAKTIAESAPLDEAARRMTVEHVHRLVVVDHRHRPIGVISESDIVREIADCCDDG